MPNVLMSATCAISIFLCELPPAKRYWKRYRALVMGDETATVDMVGTCVNNMEGSFALYWVACRHREERQVGFKCLFAFC